MIKSMIFGIILITILTHPAIAEIKDREILSAFFDGCISEAGEMNDGMAFEYCGCATNKISQNMTIEEILDIDKNLQSVGTDKERNDIILSNKKFKSLIKKCLNSALE